MKINERLQLYVNLSLLIFSLFEAIRENDRWISDGFRSGLSDDQWNCSTYVTLLLYVFLYYFEEDYISLKKTRVNNEY